MVLPPNRPQQQESGSRWEKRGSGCPLAAGPLSAGPFMKPSVLTFPSHAPFPSGSPCLLVSGRNVLD